MRALKNFTIQRFAGWQKNLLNNHIMKIKQIKKMKIAVLYGGPSLERGISLKSGAAVINALNKLNVKNLPVIVNRDLIWLDSIRKYKPDFVFISLHGPYGEDGTVQSILEFLRIPHSGSGVLSSAISMNKLKAKEVFVANGIPTPEWITSEVTEVADSDKIKTPPFGYPCVVKPIDQGSAIGISIAKNRREYFRSLKSTHKYGTQVIVEKYIDGVELTVGIIGRKLLPVIEIVPKGKFYDFSSKYNLGMSEHIIPARVSKRILEQSTRISLKAFDTLSCRAFARVDMKVNSKNKIYVLEINTIPGMTETSLLPDAARAIGMSFEQMILEMIHHSL